MNTAMPETDREISQDTWKETIRALAACRHCERSVPPLPHTARPVFQIHPDARVLIASQAPGNLAHQSGKPFDDPSGRRLRDWLEMDEATFYDPHKVAIVPMGHCFPGYDANGGDLPPRLECAPLWRVRTLGALPNIGVTLLIGAYAQRWHLQDRMRKTLTETVLHWRDYAPEYFAIPHPSWRNNGWLKKNPFFETDVLPALRGRVREVLA